MQNIKIVREIDKEKWAKFVYNHPNGNMFQTYEMFETYRNTINYQPILISVIDDNEEIQGVLLAVIQREYSNFIGYFTARSIIIGGPLIKNNNSKVLDVILEQYNKIIENKVIYSQFRNMHNQLLLNDSYQNAGFTYKSHLNYIIHLIKGKDYVWNNIGRKRKKSIKKASKNGLIFKVYVDGIDNDIINKGFNIIKEVYNNAKIPLPDISLINNSILKLYNQNTNSFSLNSLKLSEQYDINLNSNNKLNQLNWL